MASLYCVCVGGVSATYVMTKARIKVNEQLVKYKAVLGSAGIAIPMNPIEIENLYRENVREHRTGDGKTVAYVFDSGMLALDSSGTGLWGPIDAVVCFDGTGETLKGLSFTYQVETPGLGGRIEEEWFTEQFRGKRPPLGIAKESGSAQQGEFEAVTGATISCDAVERLVNDAQKRLKGILAELSAGQDGDREK